MQSIPISNVKKKILLKIRRAFDEEITVSETEKALKTCETISRPVKMVYLRDLLKL